VYGIVKQNQGYIKVHSEVGQGTTFEICLPPHKAESAHTVAESADEAPPRGKETVLMVEDEKAILDLGKRILGQLGYTVLIADTPEEAIRLVEEHTGDIHLLLTDVVMPQMTGQDLAARLGSIKPDLKCLYISGYTADAITHRGVLEKGIHLMEKPFSGRDLAVKVREVLDQKLADTDGE
jgi:two-component system cell cycle sensor histidine kinase/response regulator CckA